MLVLVRQMRANAIELASYNSACKINLIFRCTIG